jgi:hypothetical protein
MINVTIKFEGHTLTGCCDFYGPYHETDGAEVEECEPANSDPCFIARAEQAIEAAAYEQYSATRGRPQGGRDYDDYSDDYNDWCSSRGGDYWRDPESGEYRCG